jgi:hypothetical protein
LDRPTLTQEQAVAVKRMAQRRLALPGLLDAAADGGGDI